MTTDAGSEKFGDMEATACLALAEQAAPELLGPQAQAWLDRLEAEYAHLDRALDWFVEQGQPDHAVRLGAALWRFWQERGRFAEGRARLEAALAAPGGDAATAARAEALYGAGLLAFRQSDNEACRRLTEESLEVARARGDERASALALVGLCRAALRDGDHARLREFAAEALDLSQRAGAPREAGAALHMLATASDIAGDVEHAKALYEESLAVSRHLGDARMVGIELYNLGELERRTGEPETAWALLTESLGNARERGDQMSIAYCLTSLAGLAAEQEPKRAALLFGAAEGAFESLGVVPDPGNAEEFEQIAEAITTRLGEEDFMAARTAARAIPLDEAVAQAQSARRL